MDDLLVHLEQQQQQQQQQQLQQGNYPQQGDMDMEISTYNAGAAAPMDGVMMDKNKNNNNNNNKNQQQVGWKSKIKNFKFPWTSNNNNNNNNHHNHNNHNLQQQNLQHHQQQHQQFQNQQIFNNNNNNNIYNNNNNNNNNKRTKQQNGYNNNNNYNNMNDENETQAISLDDVSLQTQQNNINNNNNNMNMNARILMNYEILDTLGKGMSGKVKRARHVNHGGYVALKIIDKATAKKRTLQLLHTEIVVMRSLSHPNILDLYEVNLECRYPKRDGSKTRDVMVLALQLAEGGEIFDFMMYGGAFKEIIARTYFKQLLSALELCHTHGIYHRDIKPENLLLDSQFQLKVADFGLAAMRSSPEYLLKTECGTRTYMAPEILARKQYDGAKGDVWAAGIVLFIMLAGNPPFTIAKAVDWWYNALQDGDYEKFWKAHKRYAPFPVGAIPLINQIFQIDFKKRANVTKLLQHPWMQEPCLTPQELYEEMSRKKMEITEKKLKMKEKTKKRKLESQSAKNNVTDNVFKKDTERSTAIDSLIAGGVVGTTNISTTPKYQMLPAFPQGEKKLKMKGFFTQFYTYEPAEEFFSELKLLLQHHISQNAGEKITFVEKSIFSMKVQMVQFKKPQQYNEEEEAFRNEIEFKINIYKSPDEDDDSQCNIVIFERLSGDIFEFQKIFKFIKSKQLGDDDDDDDDNNNIAPPEQQPEEEQPVVDLPDFEDEVDMI